MCMAETSTERLNLFFVDGMVPVYSEVFVLLVLVKWVGRFFIKSPFPVSFLPVGMSAVDRGATDVTRILSPSRANWVESGGVHLVSNFTNFTEHQLALARFGFICGREKLHTSNGRVAAEWIIRRSRDLTDTGTGGKKVWNHGTVR